MAFLDLYCTGIQVIGVIVDSSIFDGKVAHKGISKSLRGAPFRSEGLRRRV